MDKIRIVEVRILRGPNYWSCFRKELIQMKIDIGSYEELPTHKIPGFAERLEALLPSLHEHECSEMKPGGFFERVREGTWLGHVAEHIALELQTLAGMDVGYGRTRSTGKHGEYHMVYSYEIESAGIYAGKAALRLVEALAENLPYDVAKDIEELKTLKMHDGLGPSTMAIIKEASKRDIPVRRLDKHSLIMLGHGKYQQLIKCAMAGSTSAIGVDMADDKEYTRRVLREAFIPVPEGRTVTNIVELENAIKKLGFPIVIKPVQGNHGRGITTNINDPESAKRSFQRSQEISNNVLVEKFIPGSDYRFLVINYKLIAVAKRLPAMVSGNGVNSIDQLISETNKDPRRGLDHENVLSQITVDDSVSEKLARTGLSLDTVLPEGELVFLKDTANISTGGTSRDITHIVHPENIAMAERIARLMKLDICGIDIVAEDINIPITKANGAVLEVNASPGLRMHISPARGLAKNVAIPIIDMLYPAGTPSRIPIIAVTGTNGKTTTVRLVAHIATTAGYKTGYTSTDGVYINGNCVQKGDCSGPVSALNVLRDPLVDFAVLECARGGILRSGLGFDKCKTSIITNITDDHLGLDGIDSLRELTKVKAVVAHSTDEDGYSILNADDERLYALRRKLDCKIALFSIDENSKRIKEHCQKGGVAAVVEKGYFTIYEGQYGYRIAKVNQVPLTLDGRAECMIKNILPAMLAAYVNGISIDTITASLQTFYPSHEQSQGRMNIFPFRNFSVMVDYAHNTDGFRMLKKFMDQTPATVKVGIITSPGDRRNEDIRAAGAIAAEAFDEIIIRHDDDLRGRSREEITGLLQEGIRGVGRYIPVKIISDEIEAIKYAMDMAVTGSFIVVCSEKVSRTIDFLSGVKEFERSFQLSQK